MTTKNQPMQVVLVLGMSGAGKSTVLHTLEDMGYETVDNVPLSLIPALCTPALQEKQAGRPAGRLAVSAGAATRDFSAETFRDMADRLRRDAKLQLRIIFLDCADDVLIKRYSETRRRHPLALDRPVEDGIARERQLLGSIRMLADTVMDSTDYDSAELRRLIRHQFGGKQGHLSLCVTSFSFAKGLPRDADMVFDVRFLRNPHYVEDLRPFTGRDAAVQAYVMEDQGFESFMTSLKTLVAPLLPRYAEEGKSYLTIAIGCTGGKHRSVCVAEQLHAWLGEQGYSSLIRHRDAPLSGFTQ